MSRHGGGVAGAMSAEVVRRPAVVLGGPRPRRSWPVRSLQRGSGSSSPRPGTRSRLRRARSSRPSSGSARQLGRACAWASPRSPDRTRPSGAAATAMRSSGATATVARPLPGLRSTPRRHRRRRRCRGRSCRGRRQRPTRGPGRRCRLRARSGVTRRAARPRRGLPPPRTSGPRWGSTAVREATQVLAPAAPVALAVAPASAAGPAAAAAVAELRAVVVGSLVRWSCAWSRCGGR
mmetsp:Transcript_176587/g.566198  ORF Transcript_176587/g.566198 Transcript_176587/m.566198 type:complete len:235 (+) Transcript_176587:1015-1719(+)